MLGVQLDTPPHPPQYFVVGFPLLFSVKRFVPVRNQKCNCTFPLADPTVVTHNLYYNTKTELIIYIGSQVYSTVQLTHITHYNNQYQYLHMSKNIEQRVNLLS